MLKGDGFAKGRAQIFSSGPGRSGNIYKAIQGDKRNSRGGFTLIELMLVLLLLGFMLLLTFPNFRDFLNPPDAKRAVLGLVATLRYAQSQAAATKHLSRLEVDLKENAYWVSLEGERGKFLRDSSGKPAYLPFGVIFLDLYHPERGKVREGLGYVEFSPTGWADECTFHLRRGAEELFTVFVHPLGGKIEVVSGYVERVKE